MHPDLRDDTKVPEGSRRFLPTRFDTRCRALDVRGEPCTELACPRCHLVMPRDVIEMEPTFYSILGAPSSGKSYFLTAALWRLRSILRQRFSVTFEDSDPVSNRKVHEYEETLFLNTARSQHVALPKTELEGDLYEQVEIEPDRVMLLPRPFVFRARLSEEHPRVNVRRQNGRAVCLYDNAGEHFFPGADTANSPGTRHLAVAKALLFVFDPTQHAAIRERCSAMSDDPQLRENQSSNRQDHILAEATRRIRAELGLPQNRRDPRPLIVVLSKFDAWKGLFDDKDLQEEWAYTSVPGEPSRLNLDNLTTISGRCRELLTQLAPEIVSTADAFSEHVIFIPVSALGCSPVEIPGLPTNTGPTPLGVRPGDINPVWAEVPLMYAMQQTIPGLIGGSRPK